MRILNWFKKKEKPVEPVGSEVEMHMGEVKKRYISINSNDSAYERLENIAASGGILLEPLSSYKFAMITCVEKYMQLDKAAWEDKQKLGRPKGAKDTYQRKRKKKPRPVIYTGMAQEFMCMSKDGEIKKEVKK